MNEWIDLLSTLQFLDNSALRWVVAGITFGAVYFFLKIVLQLAVTRLQKGPQESKSPLKRVAQSLIVETRTPFLLACAFKIALYAVEVSDRTHFLVGRGLGLIGVLQIGIFGSTAIELSIEEARQRKGTTDPAALSTLGLIGTILKFALTVALVLTSLNFLGVNITALVAGLGIGGIAVALAAQNLLGDLFASLTIVLDKPFVVGETLMVGDYTGTVERIGLKNTRLRSVNGEMLIFSNNDLLQSRLKNLKRMTERRLTQRLNIAYGTDVERLAQIPHWVKACVNAQPGVRFDSCHLILLADSAQIFELVYWFGSPDGNAAAATHHLVLLSILSKLQTEGVALAYPTQTLHIHKGA